ncbi:hypothetical protein PENVUL_c002G00643 [Penicillium vulpinum]|uniref:Protein kinase domain-containing protein n=1 Tax=Penicillium vulpinum TaxID=29845 RepID=A0A1V6SCA4_9EURO|nr:hypothetical protein PENVUL_c002G00643 [Penicillium vulpinum]
MLVDDEYPPSAIFLEYITGLEMITLEDYTQQRMDKIVSGIQQIHKALVRHRDPKPKNMMVVTDTAERVVWMDFDRAETYNGHQVTSEQEELLRVEEEIVVDIGECLVRTLPLKTDIV